MYMKKKNIPVLLQTLFCAFTMVLVLYVSPVFSESRIIPTVSISQEYTDNYHQTDDSAEDEWITRYEPGITFEYFEKKGRLDLSYFPSYVDHMDNDEDDTWEHRLSMDGRYSLSKYTDLTVSEQFARITEINQRTGTREDHDTNTTFFGIDHRFGRKDSVGADFTYATDRYENPNLDEYDRYKPSAYLRYWFNAEYGVDSSVFYEHTRFDLSGNEEDTWRGDIRIIRMMSRHFQIYVKYAQSFSEDDTEEHHVFNPSAGFDWDVSETSTVSMGAGVLFHEYDRQEDSENLFFELDAFKIFEISRRATFSISAASGYEESGDDMASLGFNIYYQTGFNYNYALTRKAGLDISGSYKRDEFEEEQADRTDHIWNLNAGINWNPLRWMELDLSYAYKVFETDEQIRDDYEENRVILSVTLTPYHPVKVSGRETRDLIEGRIFDM